MISVIKWLNIMNGEEYTVFADSIYMSKQILMEYLHLLYGYVILPDDMEYFYEHEYGYIYDYTET